MRLRDWFRRKQQILNAVSAAYDRTEDMRVWRSMENAAQREAIIHLQAMGQAQARCSYCGKPAMEFLLTPVCAEHRINEAHALQNRYQGLSGPSPH